MTTLRSEPQAKSLRFDANTMWVELVDGRRLGVPLAYFPRLLNATVAQRKRYCMTAGGSKAGDRAHFLRHSVWRSGSWVGNPPWPFAGILLPMHCCLIGAGCGSGSSALSPTRLSRCCGGSCIAAWAMALLALASIVIPG